MRKVVLFIAMSLDGYIADNNGQVDWLTGHNPHGDSMESYKEFIKSIDTVILGWNTYHQIATELFTDGWVYHEFTSYVITHREHTPEENIIFTQEAVGALIARLKQQKGKDIWICGGADIVQQLIRNDLIDRFHLSIIPTILGAGIRLFEEGSKEKKLQLVGTQGYNGIVDVVYEYRK